MVNQFEIDWNRIGVESGMELRMGLIGMHSGLEYVGNTTTGVRKSKVHGRPS